MIEPPFELQVQRLFAEAPTAPDADAFAARVQARLERGWALRRLLIGAAGIAGGLIAAVQFLTSGLIGRASTASEDLSSRLHVAAAGATQWVSNTLPTHALPFGGEGLWLAAGLGAVGVALLAARLFETF
jgi:hypothetical protein